MAGRFDNALGNAVIDKVAEASDKNANILKIENIDIELLDENPDNTKIFNMEDIEILKRSITENGFTGAVDVFKKPDGRYEISSGHRRVRALRELGYKQVPCLVNSMPDDMVKARKLLDSNLTNRTLHPLDYARCIEYYITYVLKPSGFKGDVDSQCAEYFNKSRSAIYKYRSIVKMIPELQELANDPQFPFTGFVSAHRLSEEMQKKLYEEIKSYPETHLDKDGNPMEVSRSYIEQTVTRLLKEEDRYKEAANKAIRDRNIEKAQEREAKEAEKASIIVNRSDNIDNIQSIEPSSDDSTGEDDVAPLPGQYSEVGGQMPLPVDDSSDDNTGYETDYEGSQEVSHDVLSQFPDAVGSDATSPSPFSNTSNRSDPFENNSPRLNEAPESSPAEVHSSTATSPIEEQSEIFQKINVIGAELDQIVASYDKISDKIRLKALLTPLKDRIDSVLNSIEA